MKHFDSNTCISDRSLNLNNLNPEAGDVNIVSHEFVKVLMILLIRTHHIVTHPEKNNAPLTKHVLTKAF